MTRFETQKLDPLGLDRSIREAAFRERSFRAAIRELRRLDDDPFFGRSDFGSDLYRAVERFPDDDPLRAPLLEWIGDLWQARVTTRFHAREVWLDQSEEISLRPPLSGVLTRGALKGRVLLRPGEEARSHLGEFLRVAPPLADLRRQLWSRRAELRYEFSLAAPPSEAPASDFAARLLRDTHDFIESAVRPGFEPWTASAVALAAGEGWPARLDTNTLRELLDADPLVRALHFDMGKLPARWSPTSFVRAFQRFGEVWAEANAPREQPFVVAFDPRGLATAGWGATFGGLPLLAPFLRRKLGLGRDEVRSHQRLLRVALLQHARLLAARVSFREALLAGSASLSDAIASGTRAVFRDELSPEATLALVRIPDRAPELFLALGMAAARAERLRDEFDEDWFRNPRAVEALRAEASRPPQRVLPDDELAQNHAALVRTLTSSFD